MYEKDLKYGTFHFSGKLFAKNVWTKTGYIRLERIQITLLIFFKISRYLETTYL